MNNIKIAIKMELDGEKFYKQQAALNKDNYLFNICMMLAEDERNHADILSKKEKSLDYELPPSVFEKEMNIFDGMKNLSKPERQVLSQLDFYKIAADIEQKSIELYQRLHDSAENEKSKLVYTYLINQEQQHYDIIDGLAESLRTAQEYVENAEFGNRPEY